MMAKQEMPTSKSQSADRNHPLVSIITPSYNQASFLEQTIRSVLEQDYPRIEYIIVDGGSTDGSVEIIKKYAHRLAWWVSEPDRGQAEAINKGLAHAQGEIVAWLNSDDLYLPGAIYKAVAALQAHPWAGMVYGDTVAIDEQGRTINLPTLKALGLEDLLAFSIINQPAVFMRGALLKQAGYLDPTYHYLLDHHLWLRIASQAEIKYIPDRWAASRYHREAKNIAQAAEFGREAYRILEWAREQSNLAPVLARIRKRAWAGAHRFNARYLLDGGLYWPSLKSYAHSLITHPPTALVEWNRMVFAVLGLFGLGGLRSVYYAIKQRRARQRLRHSEVPTDHT
jgi:glycosyltransferase involved in cell wall biosynthesis